MNLVSIIYQVSVLLADYAYEPFAQHLFFLCNTSSFLRNIGYKCRMKAVSMSISGDRQHISESLILSKKHIMLLNLSKLIPLYQTLGFPIVLPQYPLFSTIKKTPGSLLNDKWIDSMARILKSGLTLNLGLTQPGFQKLKWYLDLKSGLVKPGFKVKHGFN